jgi:hypothetical protein
MLEGGVNDLAPGRANRKQNNTDICEIKNSWIQLFTWKDLNVRPAVKFGPLTLMEGWVKIDPGNFQKEILELAGKFLEIEHLVDDAHAKFK